jgi:hypothetical protein
MTRGLLCQLNIQEALKKEANRELDHVEHIATLPDFRPNKLQGTKQVNSMKSKTNGPSPVEAFPDNFIFKSWHPTT